VKLSGVFGELSPGGIYDSHPRGEGVA